MNRHACCPRASSPLGCSRRPARPVRQHDGFTVIEILLVLAVVATIAAIAVPRYINASYRYHARAAAHQLVAQIELARDRARQQSQTIAVAFDTTANTITIDRLEHPDAPGQPYVRRFDEPPYSVHLVEVDFAGQSRVHFDAHGLPDASGTIVLESPNTRKRITLDEADGQLRIDP